mgnify:FL=1
MGSSTIVSKVKIIGPMSPKEFSDITTLETKVNSGLGAITNASGTNKILDTEIIQVLGNFFLIVTYEF